MSCCGEADGVERIPGTGCCGSNCTAESAGCPSSTPRTLSCQCQTNVGCLNRSDCGGFRPSGTAATGACPGPCQCVEEEVWNSNAPPKPNCEWLSNFCELRRQWSDHARQQNCKCCNCQPCITAASCQPCLPTTFRTCGFVGASSDCQDYRENRRLAGGASDKRDSSPAESTSSKDSSNVRREAGGGGCPASGCQSCQPTGCRSPSTDRFSTSSCDPSCTLRPSNPPCRSRNSCRPCGPAPKSILKKKRACCQCLNGFCMCQPMPRNCNCPPPIQIDARAERDCSCDCPSSPECACPPSERRFSKSTVKCPNARLCCPVPRLPPGPKCHCVECQPCLPGPCDPCTSSICRPGHSPDNAGRSASPCTSQRSTCRPRSPVGYKTTGQSTMASCCKTVGRCCNDRSSRCDDTSSSCTRASNRRPSSAIACCERRTGQSSTIRRGRAGGDDLRDKVDERENDERENDERENDETTNRNDLDTSTSNTSEIRRSIDDRAIALAAETERREEQGECPCKVGTSADCRRRIDTSDKIRSDGAFNHTSSSSSIGNIAYQSLDESDLSRYDIEQDYDNDLGIDVDDHARPRFDLDTPYASSSSQRCYCGQNGTSCEPVCDPTCDHCCSFVNSLPCKKEPRCRCGPDENGCDKTCAYCCAFSDLKEPFPKKYDRLERDTLDLNGNFNKSTINNVDKINNDDDDDDDPANVTRGVVGPVGGDSTTTVTWNTCTTQTSRYNRKRSNVFSYIGAIGHSTLSPSPLTLLSFVLLILLAITCTSGLIIYRRYFLRTNLCLRYTG